ncbi:MAG TPA: zf-TFIIB domain-containing protein [Flavisolibacter sp.]|nr:zf-TFIIB domain-containing protein [Flavisolibacter sp.]
MKCPNCNETLVMTDRQGVEIDYCPQCRGVWLDRGELDKIIERSATFDQGSSTPPPSIPPPSAQQPYPNQQYDKGYQDPYYKHKKKKGFLDDLFDF